MIKHSKNVPPFLQYCSSTIPAMFDDSMSYYEALCALWKWLQSNLVDVVNNNAEVTEQYIKVVEELDKYVRDYFKNLDVQEEINNKLDDMAESGQLQEIISEFLGLGAMVCFNTESEMINSENLIKGSKVQTLGKNAKNDGYGAYYTIDESGDIELDNGLFATLVDDFGGNNYYDEITCTQIHRYDTDCYITIIPKLDNTGNIIMPHVEHDSESPSKHAQKTFSTLTINASSSIQKEQGGTYVIPNMIGNGQLIRTDDSFVNSGISDNYVYLGIKADRSISEYKVNNTTGAMLLNDGCIEVFDVYYRLVEHGVASSLDGIVVNFDSTITTNANPRQCFGVKQNGDIIILTCDGRTGNDAGLTSAQCQEILIEFGAYNAWNVDGGGSTSTTLKGSKVNRNIDNNRSSERNIPYTLNFRKQTIDKELAKVVSLIGSEKSSTLEQVYESVVQNRAVNIDGKDLNTLTDELLFAYGNNITNKPSGAGNGYFVNIPHSYSVYRNLYAKQYFMDRDTTRLWNRTIVNGDISPWLPVGENKLSIQVGNVTLNSTNVYQDVNCYGKATKGNTSGIILNEDGSFSFHKSLMGKSVTMNVSGNTGTVANGSKFISFKLNGTQQTSYVTKFTKQEGQVTAFNVQWVFDLVNVSQNTKYIPCFYGTTNDTFDRVRVDISVN